MRKLKDDFTFYESELALRKSSLRFNGLVPFPAPHLDPLPKGERKQNSGVVNGVLVSSLKFFRTI